jgi:hypothetical protein
MRNLLWDRVTAERRDPPRVSLARRDPYEFDPPSPLQIFSWPDCPSNRRPIERLQATDPPEDMAGSS